MAGGGGVDKSKRYFALVPVLEILCGVEFFGLGEVFLDAVEFVFEPVAYEDVVAACGF